MSVAGLRYGAGQANGYANGYAETKSGSFIFHGDAASFHDWEDICREQCPQLSMSDCMSLVKHLNAPIMARCQDKRLEIEMKAIRQSLRDDQDKETYEKFVRGGDKLIWIHTSSMVADALTKRMKPDFLIGVLRTNRYRVDLAQRNKEK